MATKNLFDLSAALQAAETLKEFEVLCAKNSEEIAQLRSNPGWASWLEKRRARLAALEEIPPVPEEEVIPPAAPVEAETEEAEAEEATAEAAEAAEAEAEELLPSSWDGKKYSELSSSEFRTLVCELRAIAGEMFAGNEAAEEAAISRLLGRAEAEDWQLSYENCQKFLATGAKWQETWEEVSAALAEAGLFLTGGLVAPVQDRMAGKAMRQILLNAEEGRYGPLRPYQVRSSMARAMEEAEPLRRKEEVRGNNRNHDFRRRKRG